MRFYSKNLTLYALASFGLSMLVACDDSTSTANESSGISMLGEGESLPKCNDKNEGGMAYLAD